MIFIEGQSVVSQRNRIYQVTVFRQWHREDSSRKKPIIRLLE